MSELILVKEILFQSQLSQSSISENSCKKMVLFRFGIWDLRWFLLQSKVRVGCNL